MIPVRADLKTIYQDLRFTENWGNKWLLQIKFWHQGRQCLNSKCKLFFFVGEPSQSCSMVRWARNGVTTPFYCHYTLPEPALKAKNTLSETVLYVHWVFLRERFFTSLSSTKVAPFLSHSHLNPFLLPTSKTMLYI